MAHPQAYSPEYGYRFQLVVKTPNDRTYEHCDYAVDKADKNHLMKEYALAYGPEYVMKAIPLPKKYWKENVQ